MSKRKRNERRKEIHLRKDQNWWQHVCDTQGSCRSTHRAWTSKQDIQHQTELSWPSFQRLQTKDEKTFVCQTADPDSGKKRTVLVLVPPSWSLWHFGTSKGGWHCFDLAAIQEKRPTFYLNFPKMIHMKNEIPKRKETKEKWCTATTTTTRQGFNFGECVQGGEMVRKSELMASKHTLVSLAKGSCPCLILLPFVFLFEIVLKRYFNKK